MTSAGHIYRLDRWNCMLALPDCDPNMWTACMHVKHQKVNCLLGVGEYSYFLV